MNRKNVTVRSQCTAPVEMPLSPQTPLGTSTATMGKPLACALAKTSAATPSSGRVKPAPNRASTTSACPSRQALPSGKVREVCTESFATSGEVMSAHCACQASQARRASPTSCSGSASNAIRTGQPCCNRTVAATRPSPPLLPGPHSTTVARGDQRCAMADATARPADCIRTKPGVPASMVRASACAICPTVSNSHAMLVARAAQRPKPGLVDSVTPSPPIRNDAFRRALQNRQQEHTNGRLVSYQMRSPMS